VLVDALRKTKSGVSGRSQKRQRTATAARRGGSDLWTSGDNDDSDTQSGDSSYEYGERQLNLSAKTRANLRIFLGKW